MNKEFLTVAEYAEIKGISKQRVYQLLNKGLKPFVQVVEGRKVIDIRALSAEELKPIEQGVDPHLNKGLNTNNQELEVLQQALEILKGQLEVKDQQIAELQRENATKDRHIQEQATELARLLSQSQELQRNNQLLLAQKTQTESEPQPEPEVEEVLTEVEAPPPPQKKKFFGWLFGRG